MGGSPAAHPVGAPVPISQDWPEPSTPWLETTPRRTAEDLLAEQVNHWRANHDNQVTQKRIVAERLRKAEERIKELEAALEEHWLAQESFDPMDAMRADQKLWSHRRPR